MRKIQKFISQELAKNNNNIALKYFKTQGIWMSFLDIKIAYKEARK